MGIKKILILFKNILKYNLKSSNCNRKKILYLGKIVKNKQMLF
jgi:hypothetical protein